MDVAVETKPQHHCGGERVVDLGRMACELFGIGLLILVLSVVIEIQRGYEFMDLVRNPTVLVTDFFAGPDTVSDPNQ